MTTRVLLAGLMAAALAAGAARAQSPPPALDESTALFCRDDSGDVRPMRFATLGTVMRRYASRFSFGLRSAAEPNKALHLLFSDPEHSPYFISYEAEVYDDGAGHKGVALNSMHLFLDNADRDIKGTPMCYFTEFGR